MSQSILVTYATRYGSTREVAERVAAVLRARGLSVELQPARKVSSLESYDAVVLGAPLYIGRWLKEAQQFLARQQQGLSTKPVALFTLGPTKTADVNDPTVLAQLEKELGRVPWLKPVASALFGGVYDPARLGFPDNLLRIFPGTPLFGLPASDTRDWEAIEAWARSLPELLQAT